MKKSILILFFVFMGLNIFPKEKRYSSITIYPLVLNAQTPFSINSQRNIHLPQGLDTLSSTDNHLY
ncbi:MAG: hypothetical protein IIU30_05295, partial [Treponema sp.]|nr:hypothetical protein [Treponema sp.]